MMSRGIWQKIGFLRGGITDRDVIDSVTENPVDLIFTDRRRQARLDQKAIKTRFHSEKIFRDSVPVPCGGAGQPTVLGNRRNVPPCEEPGP